MTAAQVETELGVTGGTGKSVRTDIPGRLDQLPWSRWHWIVIVALGITWILDGLEVTLVGSISGVLTDKGTLHFSTAHATAAGSFYLAGAGVGALVFGCLPPRSGGNGCSWSSSASTSSSPSPPPSHGASGRS